MNPCLSSLALALPPSCSAPAGPIVAVQDQHTELVEYWTPPGLPEGISCYIGRYLGKFFAYERTSGLVLPYVRCSYPDYHLDAQGHPRLGRRVMLNEPDADGFASVARLKLFYGQTNPAFEAANPDCSTIRGLVEKLQLPTAPAILAQGYAQKARDWKDAPGGRSWLTGRLVK